jgi:hypothetical protein
MVTSLRPRNPLIFALGCIFAISIVGAHETVLAQGEAYRVAIITNGGGPGVSGFLYAVNDTAIVVLPATRLNPKGLRAAMERSSPISIPIQLVKRVAVAKVRTIAHDVTVNLLIASGYSISYLLLLPPTGATPFYLIPYTLTVTVLSLVTTSLIYVKKFRPTTPGFTVLMQKYCLHKSGLMVDGQ